MTKPVKHKSLFYHWIAWIITLEVVHVLASEHATYKRGAPFFQYLIEQFKIMQETAWQSYMGIVVAAFVFAYMTDYWYRTRMPGAVEVSSSTPPRS